MESQYRCRICLDDGYRSEFIAPCKCSGSSRWVHRTCLDRWRSTREDRAFSKCTECLTKYKFIDPNQLHNNQSSYCSSGCLFVCLVGRDILLLFTVISLIVLGLSALVYECDKGQSVLITFFHMYRYYLLFYALAGLFIFFAIVGLIGLIIYMNGGNDCNTICPSTNNNHNHCGYCSCFDCTCLYWDSFYYIPYTSTTSVGQSAGGSNLCCAECCGADICPSCCTSGTRAVGGTSSGAECCSCHACTAADCSSCSICDAGAVAGAEEGALYCCIALFLLLVVLGIFISMFLGIMAMNYLIAKHVHVLRKWTLTKDFIVADLAENEIIMNRIPSASISTTNPTTNSTTATIPIISASSNNDNKDDKPSSSSSSSSSFPSSSSPSASLFKYHDTKSTTSTTYLKADDDDDDIEMCHQSINNNNNKSNIIITQSSPISSLAMQRMNSKNMNSTPSSSSSSSRYNPLQPLLSNSTSNEYSNDSSCTPVRTIKLASSPSSSSSLLPSLENRNSNTANATSSIVKRDYNTVAFLHSFMQCKNENNYEKNSSHKF